MKRTKQEEKDLLVLKAALKVLRRQHRGQKCSEYGFACAQCNLTIMLEMFDSYVNFWFD